MRVAINGYGRIGRVSHRVILEKYITQMEVVAINAGSSTDLQGWAYLLQYDSAYGPLNTKVTVEVKQQGSQLGYIVVGENRIPVFSEKDPTKLPWKDLDVDTV